MSKSLIVLAECVDARSGKRFRRGEVFEPAPTTEQAQRLVKAGCLSAEALDAAKKAEAEAEKRAAAAEKKKSAESGAIEKAKVRAENARIAVANAETALDAATGDQKGAAEKSLADSRAEKLEADAALAELAKG